MTESVVGRRFGTGLLSRAAALVYHLLVIELLLLATAAPALLLVVLLDRDLSNLPLVAACAVPAGPALSAAAYALHHRRLDLTELRPAALFRRGYRLNARGALQVWAPWLIWMTVLGVNLGHLPESGLPGWWAVPVVVVSAAATLWVLNAMVITSLYAFRTRDVVRLAAYFLVRTPKVTIANLSLIIVALGVVLVSSEAVLALLASVFTLVLLHNSRPLIAAVRDEFTA